MTIYDAESPFDQLVGARERGERPVAPRANLYGANLTGINLYGADLRDADLRDADLEEHVAAARRAARQLELLVEDLAARAHLGDHVVDRPVHDRVVPDDPERVGGRRRADHLVGLVEHDRGRAQDGEDPHESLVEVGWRTDGILALLALAVPERKHRDHAGAEPDHPGDEHPDSIHGPSVRPSSQAQDARQPLVAQCSTSVHLGTTSCSPKRRAALGE